VRRKSLLRSYERGGKGKSALPACGKVGSHISQREVAKAITSLGRKVGPRTFNGSSTYPMRAVATHRTALLGEVASWGHQSQPIRLLQGRLRHLMVCKHYSGVTLIAAHSVSGCRESRRQAHLEKASGLLDIFNSADNIAVSPEVEPVTSRTLVFRLLRPLA